MSGKRILDAIALLRVTKNVAYNHFAIRWRQAELYSKTSSIVKALRGRQGPGFASSSHSFSQTPGQAVSESSIPKADKHTGPQKSLHENPGIKQTQFNDRSQENTTANPASRDDIEIRQKKASRASMPDGSIPPKDSPINAEQGDPHSSNTTPISYSKTPLESQESDNLYPQSSTASSIPTPRSSSLSSKAAKIAQRNSESQIPSKTAEPPSTEAPDFSIDQEQDTFYQAPGQTEPVLSALPRVKVPKIENDIQAGDSHIPGNLNADVYYSGGGDEKNSQPSEEQLSQLFHSPRAAKLLGNKSKHAPGGVGSRRLHTSARQDQNSGEAEKQELKQLAEDMAKDIQSGDGSSQARPYEMRESRVPSSRMGRLFEYGGLAASMAWGAVNESVTRSGGSGGSLMLSAANMERLVAKLSKMRGAALKLGQMISFQDIKMLPPPIIEVLQRVQDSADYMPASQRDKVIAQDLGPNWKDLFESFEEKPMAAASIGQVHGAVLKSGQHVAVKVQYPGVADSISSDLNNLSVLLTASRLLPKGLYLDKTIANARTELAWECDYVREAAAAKRFKELLADDTEVFVVPGIIEGASGKQVLTMEHMQGVAVTKVKTFTQEQKDWIGTQIMRLCLREIVEFKYMQTDPNWTNFLYNKETNKLELLDFGASREYPEKFVNLYIRVLNAASKRDRKTCRDLSVELGYLTGYESKAMLNAHIDSVMTLAEPFMAFAPDVYDFKDQTITDRVRDFIPTMLRERLAPPPEETYSLHRKLSGAFLLCAKLGSQVRCKELFQDAIHKAGIA